MTGDPIIDPPFDVAGYNRHLEEQARTQPMTAGTLLGLLTAMVGADPSVRDVPLVIILEDTDASVKDAYLAFDRHQQLAVCIDGDG